MPWPGIHIELIAMTMHLLYFARVYTFITDDQLQWKVYKPLISAIKSHVTQLNELYMFTSRTYV